MHHTDRNAHNDLRDTARMPPMRMRHSRKRKEAGANALAVACTLIALACFLTWLAR
jgi:hypothetical protein